MSDHYRFLLMALPLAEIESAARKAEELLESTEPSAPYYEEVAELARIASEVAEEKRRAANG